MIVPIDLLKPIFDDLDHHRPAQPPGAAVARPLCHRDRATPSPVLGLAGRGPAQQSDLRTGDIIMAVAGTQVKRARRAFPPRLVAGASRRRWSR